MHLPPTVTTCGRPVPRGHTVTIIVVNIIITITSLVSTQGLFWDVRQDLTVTGRHTTPPIFLIWNNLCDLSKPTGE